MSDGPFSSGGVTGGARVAGLMGWPVAHSLSPALHGAWIGALGLDALYAPFPVAPESALEAFRALPKLGLQGVNLTIPHKVTALQLADERTPRAEAIGAANVLRVCDGARLQADNTDVDGVLHALRDAPRPEADHQALLLGAGGAARAIAYGLMQMGWRRLLIVNRSQDKADALVHAAQSWGLEAEVRAAPWGERHVLAGKVKLIANATSLGMEGQPPLALDLSAAQPGLAVFDSVYAPLRTALLEDASRRGLAAFDGLNMLIGQAMPAFEAFFGVPPPAPSVFDARAFLLHRLGQA